MYFFIVCFPLSLNGKLLKNNSLDLILSYANPIEMSNLNVSSVSSAVLKRHLVKSEVATAYFQNVCIDVFTTRCDGVAKLTSFNEHVLWTFTQETQFLIPVQTKS